MPASALHKVLQATVMAKLTSCSTAWIGFCSASIVEEWTPSSGGESKGYCAENTAGITEQLEEADGALL